jgi:hypothetical protein
MLDYFGLTRDEVRKRAVADFQKKARAVGGSSIAAQQMMTNANPRAAYPVGV